MIFSLTFLDLHEKIKLIFIPTKVTNKTNIFSQIIF